MADRFKERPQATMRIRTPGAAALEMVISYHVGCVFADFSKRHPEPGALLNRLPDETREKLATLKSDDVANIRGDVVARFL
jgi:hypothetical protein